MPICCPDISTPELMTIALRHVTKGGSYKYGKKLILEFPSLKDTISGSGWPGGVLSLYIPWKYAQENQVRRYVLCSVVFQAFTNNCGIRAIMCNNIVYPEFGKLWFQIFEAYAWYLNYSVLVGSTGQQTGASHLKYIQDYGVDWNIDYPGQNRRVSNPDTLSVYWKYLTPPTIEIAWETNIPDAQQITDS